MTRMVFHTGEFLNQGCNARERPQVGLVTTADRTGHEGLDHLFGLIGGQLVREDVLDRLLPAIDVRLPARLPLQDVRGLVRPAHGDRRVRIDAQHHGHRVTEARDGSLTGKGTFDYANRGIACMTGTWNSE